MPKTRDITRPTVAPSDLDQLRRRSDAFLDFESGVSDMQGAAELTAAVLESTMRPANPADFPVISGLATNGFKVFILTETQVRVLEYASFHASEVAQRLAAQWDIAHEAGA